MKALITGITGQDGAYLSQYLLSLGYEVHGLVRRKADPNVWRLKELGILDKVTLHTGDVTDTASLRVVFDSVRPDEVYNLAAQSFVAASFQAPASTFAINAQGVLNVLEELRHADRFIKFYQASTSEMFGLTDLNGQHENTPFHPRSPYGVAKLAAHWATINYRETYDIMACTGILFNHESPLRGEEFVTRKVTKGVARIVAGLQDVIALGNTDAIRDWGHAEDYVKAMHAMLQYPDPGDYVIATGESHTIHEMCEIAFNHVGLDYRNHIITDPALYRPCEVPVLKGNARKAKVVLGWEPAYSFKHLIEEMVDEDLHRCGLPAGSQLRKERERGTRKHG